MNVILNKEKKETGSEKTLRGNIEKKKITKTRTGRESECQSTRVQSRISGTRMRAGSKSYIFRTILSERTRKQEGEVVDRAKLATLRCAGEIVR